MESFGLKCFYFAGELDRSPERSYLVQEAHFTHPDIAEINKKCFGVTVRDRFTTRQIHELKGMLKDHLYAFVERFDIDLIVAENTLTIPMNIPLGIALTEFIAETNFLTIAHHHDFYWERDRFAINAVSDYLRMAFPPDLPSIRHLVINSFADKQLSFRTGISARIAPNIMDFENPPPAADGYASDVRQSLGIGEDELFVLQPTRVVKRKGIEHAIELVHRLGMRAKLVISHASGDEGDDYERRIKEYSELMKVDTIFVSDTIGEKRGTTPDGRKIYTLEDIYPYADLVTYPSTFEGFGNAFLEAIYFRKPVVVNLYSIYLVDIKPKGFSAIELDGYVTDAAVRKTRQILEDHELRKKMVDQNYEIAKSFFSYSVLRRRIKSFLEEPVTVLKDFDYY
ncbi:MAG: glycosyltransferase family 4 protein [Deltaproteobacteria bacterium]|nr:glycosyltransferase family 4 protein [Deltaproteobacteria bacterium]MBW2152093.1 glycosyltransferase family 4 protein [Deltaproteobacteria bacterium]